MNTLLVFTVLFAGACMADVSHIVQQQHHQQQQQPFIKTLESIQDALPDGTYQYGYKTENGIVAEAQGNPDGESRGSYQYVSPEGVPVHVEWTAGAEGFKAVGDALPAEPQHVARTLAYNAAHPHEEEPTKYVN